MSGHMHAASTSAQRTTDSEASVWWDVVLVNLCAEFKDAIWSKI